MPDEVRAYAKIIGPGWEYYMIKPKIILGRGGKDVKCDVIISTESAVSRQHFTIRFAPELQAFEVENLSKNGVLVNGEFVHRLSPPVLLRSQADIAFGRYDPLRITFLLPVGVKSSVKKRELAAEREVPLMQWIGEQLVEHDYLSAIQLRMKIDEAHPNQLRKLGSEEVIASSIRHILTYNSHIFAVVDPMELERRLIGTGADTMWMATFEVKDEHKSRFFHYISDHENGLHREGFCSMQSCEDLRHTPRPHP